MSVTVVRPRRKGAQQLPLLTALLLWPTLARADDRDEFDAPVQVLVSSPRRAILSEWPLGAQAPRQWLIPAAPSGEGIPLTLHRYSRFRVHGPGVAEAEFEFDEDSRPSRLLISPGSRRNRILGLVLGIVSTGMAPCALFTLGIGALSGTNVQEVGPPGWLSSSQQAVLVGGITLGLGLAGIAAGWTLYGLSKTQVQQAPP